MEDTTHTDRSIDWRWVIGAFILVLAASMLPRIGVVLAAPLVSVAIGVGAAQWVRASSGTTVGRATAAAAIAGIGALLASVAAFMFFGFVLGSDPSIQEFVRGSEPHPEARIPYDWIAPLGATAGAFAGLAVGLVNLALATIGGLLTGLFGGHTPATRPA